MSDASYTQVTGKLDCNKCVWGTRDGGCASWECEFIDRDDAVKAWRNMPSAQPEERTEERTETYTCDCISRQAAIDALRMNISIIPYAKAREYVREAIETIYNRLEELPSAEPEYKELQEWKTDFKGFIDALDMPRDDYWGIMEYIDEVPSAEPEIIRCRNCKHYRLSRDGERYCFNHDDDTLWQDDDFCSRAERRMDE